jgi:hypothetical protein
MVGRGDTCSYFYFYAKAYEDWVSDDPAGQDLDHVRHILQRVRNLMAELTSAPIVITQLVTHAGEEQAPPKRSIRTERASTQTSESWGSEGRSVARN